MAEHTEIRWRENFVNQNQILTRLPSISQLVSHLSQLVSLPLSATAANAIDAAKQNLLRQFEFFLYTFRHRADRRRNEEGRRPLDDVANDTNHKLGRKKGAEKKEEHNAKIRIVVLGFLQDEKLRSMQCYLNVNNFSSLHSSLMRFLNSQPQLKHILADQN